MAEKNQEIPLIGEHPPLYLIKGRFIYELKKRIDKARGREVHPLLVTEIAIDWQDKVEKLWRTFVQSKTKILDILDDVEKRSRLPRPRERSADFTEQEIDEFIILMKEEAGVNLGREEARTEAHRMVSFLKLLYDVGDLK